MEESPLLHVTTADPCEKPLLREGLLPPVGLPEPHGAAPAFWVRPESLLAPGCDSVRPQERVSDGAACHQMHRCSKLRKLLKRLLGNRGGLGGEKRSFWK